MRSVPTPEEVRAAPKELDGVNLLVASALYGSGLASDLRQDRSPFSLW